MFRPHDKSTLGPRFRTTETDDSIEFFAEIDSMSMHYKFAHDVENENYNQLDLLRSYMKTIFGGSEPIMARSYKNEDEKNNFSICVCGFLLNDSVDLHPVMKFFSAYEGVKITQEYESRANFWIFTFPKTECANILKGMKTFDFDADLLATLDVERRSNAAFC